MPHGLDVIHIDVDPWEIGKNYPAAVGIQGDPKATLPELCEAVRRHSGKTGHPQAAKRREAVAAANAAERAELERSAPSTGPTWCRWRRWPSCTRSRRPRRPARRSSTRRSRRAPGVRHFFKCEDAKSFFGLRGGGIGWGLPAAIGVKLALPERPVIALVGDGSAMYTCQALWTAARESVPVVYVIFNNALLPHPQAAHARR